MVFPYGDMGIWTALDSYLDFFSRELYRSRLPKTLLRPYEYIRTERMVTTPHRSSLAKIKLQELAYILLRTKYCADYMYAMEGVSREFALCVHFQ